jgi:hypothetical protein
MAKLHVSRRAVSGPAEGQNGPAQAEAAARARSLLELPRRSRINRMANEPVRSETISGESIRAQAMKRSRTPRMVATSTAWKRKEH